MTIRRHETNTSVDDLFTLIDEVKALRWIKENHKKARQYVPIIDSQIRSCRINAVHAAFAARRHDLVRELLAEVCRQRDRPVNLRINSLVASLPDSIEPALNYILNPVSEMRGHRHGSATRLIAAVADSQRLRS